VRRLRVAGEVLLGIALSGPAAAQDVSWIRSFTAPATAENLNSEAGSENQLNGDPRFIQLLREAFPQKQFFWRDKGRFTPLPELVQEFIGVPGSALLDEDRYALINGCVPHDCGDRGFLWVDTQSTGKPLLIFAATGMVNAEASAEYGGMHLRLFASRRVNWSQLPPNFKKRFSEWWVQTAQPWKQYFHERVLLITLVQPSGEEVDVTPGMLGISTK
jgi:hypothetical protein